MENRDYLDIFNRITRGVQRQWEELLLECKGINVSHMAMGVMVLCHYLCRSGLSPRLEKEAVLTAARNCFPWLVEQSRDGCPSAQFVLAAFFELGIVVEKNMATAFNWFQKSAITGCVTSQCCVGVCYKEGRGVNVDLVKAAEWLQLAADANHARSQVMLAELLAANGERTEAIRLAKLGAEAGYSHGWVVIASIYLPTRRNNYVAGDLVEARKWLEIAVNHNNVDAMCELGRLLLESEDGGAKARGVELFRQAIDLGYIEALNFLGVAYAFGRGVEQNTAEAMRLFRQAAHNGSKDACCNIGNSYYDGRGVQVDYVEAAEWYRRGAEAGEELAMVYFGNMCWNGYGVPKDSFEAVKWYRAAAERGDRMAQQYLGECYFEGSGVEMNQTEALRLISQAAEKGLQDAKDWLEKHAQNIVNN